MSRFPIRKKIRLPVALYKQGHIFFITISTHQKYPWFSRYPYLCQVLTNFIEESASTNNLKIFAWCIMPDHIHFLIHGEDIISFIRLLKGRFTPIARNIEAGRKLWQRSFYDHVIRKHESLNNVACYIWENPVRAKITDKPTLYSWSGSNVWPDWRQFFKEA